MESVDDDAPENSKRIGGLCLFPHIKTQNGNYRAVTKLSEISNYGH